MGQDVTEDGKERLEKVGDYPVLRVLGEGAMGTVYACRDESLGRDVAIKVLHQSVAKDPEMSARFLREARAMAQVQSPHVVTVFQVGEGARGPFVVMELLDGHDLSQRDGPLSERDALGHVLDAARGLAAAHESGHVHRDVKPANLVLTKGGVKLTDFGLARPVDGSADLTQAGLVVGTPHYIAPEVARGLEAAAQSDMYSLGATLYELLTDRPPYDGDAPMDVVSQHLTSSVPDIKKDRPTVSLPVKLLVERMLAKSPDDRFATYDALIERLDAVRRDPAVAGPDLSSDEPSRPSGASPAAPGHQPTQAWGSLPAEFDAPPSDNLSGVSQKAPASPRLSGSFSSVKTANLTVMFTDIAGYSERTAHQSREEADHWLELHDALLPPVIRVFRGRLIKTIGDAFLATFTSPTDAVLCGMAIQDRLHLYNKNAPERERIDVRVTLSAGEVRLRKGDIFGEAVNIASRLLDMAQPGEVLFSDAVFATMNTAEVPIESRGHHPLKGIQREVGIYGVGQDEVHDLPFAGLGLSLLPRSMKKGTVRPRVTTKVYRVASNVFPARRMMMFALALLLLVVTGVGGALLYTRYAGDERLRRIDAGEPLAVIKEIDAIPERQRTAQDHLLKGHAHFAVAQKEKAMAAYLRCAELGGTLDARAVENAFTALEGEDPGGAEKVIAALRTEGLYDRVVELTQTGGWWPRHHALTVLDLREEGRDADVERVGLRDLLEAKSCKRRRWGVGLLARAGTTDEVLDALREAQTKATDNKCMQRDLEKAIGRVLGRRNESGGDDE